MGNPFRRPRSSARFLTTALAALALISATTAAGTGAAKRRPAKREYHSHTYYVLELDPDAGSASSPHAIAAALGAEHVEQVGELEHHYLIRAPTDVVARGDQAWVSNVASAVEKRDVGRVDERDLVLERYDLLRRGQTARGIAGVPQAHGSGASLRKRGHAPAVRSLERQYPSLRAKRDLPVPPPDYEATLAQAPISLPLRPYRRDPATYNPTRQTQAGQGSTIVADMAEILGIQDPLWNKQWHLVNGIIEQNSINVTGVWRDNIHGQGVNVAIVDDGLDMHSDDLAPNFVRSACPGVFKSKVGADWRTPTARGRVVGLQRQHGVA